MLELQIHEETNLLDIQQLKPPRKLDEMTN